MRYIHAGDITPYTDRKLARFENAPLKLDTIVAIQRMACDGMRRDDILKVLAERGVKMEQISRVLDPPDEAGKKRRQEKAGVGFEKVKARYR